MPKNKENSKFVSKPAPDFTLLDDSGKEFSLKDFSGNYLLIYFYPRDLTPGCTTQACSLRDNLAELKNLGLTVLGVSCDSIESHQKFKQKHNLNFPLLADVDKKMVLDYGVWVEKSMYGKKYMGIQRDSFLINKEGRIIKHYVKVKPAEHAEELLHDMLNIKEIDV